MKHRILLQTKRLFTFLLALTLFATIAAGQKKLSRLERGSMKQMLSVIKDNVKDEYYDENYHGIDLDTRFNTASERLENAATVGEALSIIAQVLLDFDDSHVFFLPPATNVEVEYGFRSKMIGDKCFVTTVQPKSDAEKKGLKAGDQLLSIEGFRPARSNLWKINYLINVLSKRSSLNLSILRPTAEAPKQIVIKAKIKKNPTVLTANSVFKLFEPDARSLFDLNLYSKIGTVGYWKLPSFGMAPGNVDTLMGRLNDSESLILDLRGNGGGAVVTLERLAAFMFDEDFVIAEPKGRKDFDKTECKTKGDSAFKGRLIVLIDSESASASEIFARTVQLKERGVVLGDISAGAVMMSRQYVNSLRNDAIFYGASITIADVIMPDGKSLEHTGVMPNARLVPTGADLAAGRDPVLSAALKLLGQTVSPEQAGAMFEYDWLKNNRVVVIEAKNKN